MIFSNNVVLLLGIRLEFLNKEMIEQQFLNLFHLSIKTLVGEYFNTPVLRIDHKYHRVPPSKLQSQFQLC